MKNKHSKYILLASVFSFFSIMNIVVDSTSNQIYTQHDSEINSSSIVDDTSFASALVSPNYTDFSCAPSHPTK